MTLSINLRMHTMNIESNNLPRRVQRLRHELKRRELDVVRVETISPHFRSVTLGGAALAGFISASFDDHLKLILGGDGPREGETTEQDRNGPTTSTAHGAQNRLDWWSLSTVPKP